MSIHIKSKAGLTALFSKYAESSFPPSGTGSPMLKLEISHNSNVLFVIAPSDEICIKTAIDEDRKEIVNCLERSAAVDVEATFMPSSADEDFKSCSTQHNGWKEWIAKELANYPFVCVDTNILIDHYCSNLLFRCLGNAQFDKIKFRIPRLSILEIERIANEVDNDSKKEQKHRKKRLGLFATSEVMFLKAHKAELLPLSNKSIITTFLEKAGSRKVDAWIRQEVFDFASGQGFPQVLFMTSDLANGLAAVSEGFNTCVFSKMEQEKFYIESFDDASQLAEFILNIAVSFEKITLNVYLDGVNLKDSFEIEGIWSGKTPYHWVNGYIRTKEIK